MNLTWIKILVKEKITIIKCLLILAFVWSAVLVKAQVTGYLGKKFIIKTNLVNGRFLGFNNCDIEYVTKRKLSINAGVQFFNYGRDGDGVRVRTGELSASNGHGHLREFSVLKNGVTKGWIGSVGCKIYFDKIIPAPYGWYTEFNLGLGSVKFENYDVSYTYKVLNGGKNITPKEPVTGLSGSGKIIYFEALAFGYQKIFCRFISLDGKISMQGQFCSLSDDFVQSLKHNYFLRSNTLSYGHGKLSLGPAVYLKLGILLF